MSRSLTAFVVLLTSALTISKATGGEKNVVDVSADPPAIRLSGPDARYTLLLHGKTADGRLVDLTHAAKITPRDPKIVTVFDSGAVQARGDGATELTVQVAGRTLRVPVTVEGSRRPRSFHFENDIVPLLSRFGCNSSGCHGNAEGQNGFKLSVFGFDPVADHAALVK
ncbi:MAG TPA: S-layer protein, partial [Gemmataceae bacterium]|nr:S-layer protein [Gemmataceae bacterium]